MSMLKRLGRILEATVGDLIDRARDPELELARFVDDVEMSLGEVRAALEEANLRRGRLAEQAAQCTDAVGRWMSKAEQAAARDEDDLAKEALAQHHEALEEAEGCEERLAEAELAVATLRRDEAALEEKLQEARLERKRLSAKLRRAEEGKRASAALTGSDRDSGAADRVREQIMDTEAASEAAREVQAESVDAQFAGLRKHPSLDDELAQLKKRVKKQTGGAEADGS